MSPLLPFGQRNRKLVEAYSELQSPLFVKQDVWCDPTLTELNDSTSTITIYLLVYVIYYRLVLQLYLLYCKTAHRQICYSENESNFQMEF